MKLTVVGTGYVGLVSGVCFAELGNQVLCVDIDEKKIQELKKGIMPIYEQDLEEMANRNYSAGRIDYTTDIARGVKESDIIFIAVGTPSLPDGGADLSQVEAVARAVAEHINGYKIVVNKSTVPVGTQKWVTGIIKQQKQADYEFDVVSNPEFLREGTAVHDTMNADRVVIGTDSEKAGQILTELHKPLNCPIMVTTPESAEMIKYASNAFLATKISFINEIANICERVGADVQEVAKGMGLDHRISDKFLQAGLGFGGACFPKDTRALVKIGQSVGYDVKIVRSAIEVNQKQRLKPVEILQQEFGSLQGLTIAILGLAFKPNTDDMREAPSVDIIRELQRLGAAVKACDPVALKRAENAVSNVMLVADPLECLRDADAMVLVTEWPQFAALDFNAARSVMKNHVVVDGRNLYNQEKVKQAGFRIYSIGR